TTAACGQLSVRGVSSCAVSRVCRVAVGAEAAVVFEGAVEIGESEAAAASPMKPLLGRIVVRATGSRGVAGSSTIGVARAIFCVCATAIGAGGSMGLKVVGAGAETGYSEGLDEVIATR